MGMYTFVEGFKPPSDHHLKMQAVWEACSAAMIDPPLEVREYFDDSVRRARADGEWVDVKAAAEEFKDGDSAGIIVHLDQLPPGLKTLRFVNSY